ncbi:MAG: hypothetical protein ACRDRR_10735 [Pseudonocardiaceae bacterium]
MRDTPHRALPTLAAQWAKPTVAVPAAATTTRTMLRQQTPPGRGKGEQPSPDRWPGRSRLRSAEHPLDFAQVRIHALPQHSPQPLVHPAPPAA